jgi:hypothetical protein
MSEMKTLILTCPNCGTANDIPKQSVVIECGVVYCRCICRNCSQEFEERQDYWQWLGLSEGPPQEPSPGTAF